MCSRAADQMEELESCSGAPGLQPTGMGAWHSANAAPAAAHLRLEQDVTRSAISYWPNWPTSHADTDQH